MPFDYIINIFKFQEKNIFFDYADVDIKQKQNGLDNQTSQRPLKYTLT